MAKLYWVECKTKPPRGKATLYRYAVMVPDGQTAIEMVRRSGG